MDKLYEKESYLKECEAQVTESFIKDDRFYIRLNQSIFFPEEGGQYADTGILRVIDGNNPGREVRLLDGHIKRALEDEITYEVSEKIDAGDSVLCILDWEKRYLRMQNHSGEHVLTGMVHKRYGYNNVGFHLSDDGYVTLDFDGILTYEQVIEMEQEANRAIYRNIPIIDTYPSKEELCTMDYRSKIEIEGQVRIITVGEGKDIVDVCACCAPHVARTGEIGIIKVISVIKWKKGIQVSILCGERALSYIDREHDIIQNLQRSLSTSPENIENVVKSHIEEIAQLRAKLSDALEGQIIKQIEELKDDAQGLIFTESDLSALNMKNIFNALLDKSFDGVFGVFVGNDESGYRFNAGRQGMDAKDLAAAMKNELGARGGGSNGMVQGRTDAKQSDIVSKLAKI